MAQKPSQRITFPYGKRIGKYTIIKCVGQGGYGDIYYVTFEGAESPLALKFELSSAKKQALKKEYSFMLKLQGHEYFPKAIDFVENEQYRYIVMEMLGPSVSSLKKVSPGMKMTLPTTIRVSKMMLLVIKEFHSRGLVHRDIKPSNFLIRPSSENYLCLVDFGLSKLYVNEETQSILEPAEHPGFKGTLKYASPYAHYGFDQGRRDDLFSWFYSMAELYTGHLPWSHIKGKTHILKAKKKFRKSEDFSAYPQPFFKILRHIEHLNFKDEPDYAFLEDNLNQIIDSYGIDLNAPLDWEDYPNHVVRQISIFPIKRTDIYRPFQIDELVPAAEIEKFEKVQEKERRKEKQLQKKKEKEEMKEKKRLEQQERRAVQPHNNNNARSAVCLLI